jgi:LysM repeat protein
MRLKKFFLLIIFLITSYISEAQTYIHIVTKRDNIYKLAKIYDVTPKQIAEVNQLDSVNQKLVLYQKLIVPDKNYEINKVNGRTIKNLKHFIAKNETLYTIARNYGIAVYDILLLNPNIERDKALIEGEELKLQIPVFNQSQYSRQLIYLNGDLFKYDEETIADTKNVEIANQINAGFEQKILDLYEVKAIENIVDSFYLTTNDTSVMSRLLFNCITKGVNPEVDKQPWLDAMYEEILYIGSELKPKKVNCDHAFLGQAFNALNELNIANPKSDYLFGLRAILYYWIGNYRKALIFTDEAFAYNPKNESALLVRAALGQEDNHFNYAYNIYKDLHEKRPDRNFTLFNLASLNYTNNNFPKAIELYIELLKRSETYAPELNYRIGHSYLIQNNDDFGCEYIKAAEKLGYHKAIAMRTRACK